MNERDLGGKERLEGERDRWGKQGTNFLIIIYFNLVIPSDKDFQFSFSLSSIFELLGGKEEF